MKRPLLHTLYLASLLIANACGDDDDDDKGLIEETEDTVANFLEAYELAGNWTTGCAAYEAFGELINVSAKETISFGGNNQNFSYSVFEDAQCENPIASIRYMGNYSLEDDARQRPEYVEIDTTVKNVYIIPQTNALTQVLQDAQWCGVNNWQTDQEAEVTAGIGKESCQMPVTLNQTTFGLIRVSDDKLYMATPLEPAPVLESDRPSEVNPNVVYTRTSSDE